MRGSTALIGVSVIAVAAALAYEAVRPRPPAAAPVESRRPLRGDETTRMEGGFRSTFTRGSQDVFQLLAESMVGIEGGAHFLSDVSRLEVYLEDGRPVTLEARRGILRELSAQKGDVEIVLSGDVVVVDPTGLRLATDELRYDAQRRSLRAPGPARVRGPGLAGRLAGFTYSPDTRVVEADGPMDIELGDEGVPWRVDAERALYRIETGELVFEEPFRARQPDKTLIAGPSVVRTREEGGGRLVAEAPVLVSGSAGGGDLQLASNALRFEQGPGGPERARASGATSLALRRDNGQGALRAPLWTLIPRGAGGGFEARAAEGFELEWTGLAPEERWTGRGDELVVLRHADGRVERVTGSGDVAVRHAEGAQARGERFSWSQASPAEILVAGEPASALQGDDVIEAPRLRILREEGLLVGEEGSVTEIASVTGRASSLFAGQEPLRVRSERVTAPVEGGPITFEGPVRAWQLDTTLDAADMRFEREAQRLVAEGAVKGRFVIGDAESGLRPVRVWCERLVYEAGEREARLTGSVRFQDQQLEVSSRTMTVLLAREGGVERLVASGDVRLLQGPDSGSCDRLVWDNSGAEPVVDLVGETSLAKLFPAEHGQQVRATRIRYYPRTGTFETRGGQGRTVIAEPDEEE